MKILLNFRSVITQTILRNPARFIYCITILFIIPWSFPLTYRLIFIAYGLLVMSVLKEETSQVGYPEHDTIEPHKKFWTALLIFSFIFLFASRLYLFIRYGEAPLGYDTGFYWQYFHLVIPAGNIGTSMGSHLAYSSWFPLGFFNIPALAVIHILHVFNQFLIAGTIYFLLRSLPLKKYSFPVSVLGVFLFSLSVNQFMVFWWMFYKQTLALPFLLFAIALFLRGSFFALPIAGFAAAIHLSSVVPLGIAFFIFFLLQIFISIYRKLPLQREFIYTILCAILGIIFFIILKGVDDIRYYLNYFFLYKGLALNAHTWEVEQIKGLFIPFSTFRMNTLFYIPFALMGILRFKRWFNFDKTKNITLIPILFVASLILILFPFIHQHRSLIFFDILLVILAAPPLFCFIQQYARSHLGIMLLSLLCIGCVLFTSRIVLAQQPQLYADEAIELKTLKREGRDTDIQKRDDYVMTTTPLYTPWVYAFTGFEKTIVPGWLTWDKWSTDMWNEFLFQKNDERRLELLRMYGDNTIYLFMGEHQLKIADTPRLKKFIETDSHFSHFSPHIWKYTPHLPNGVL